MLASRVNDSKDLRERAAEMRASSKELKDNNTATVILRLAELKRRDVSRGLTLVTGDFFNSMPKDGEIAHYRLQLLQ